MASLLPDSGFSDVDRTTDPGYYVGHVDRLRHQWGNVKQRSFDLLELSNGDQVLDVGCGTGEDVWALAALVGNAGSAVGVDKSQLMIAEARRRSAGLALPVDFRLGDIYALDFADNTFAGCRAERVFTHLEDVGRALAELCRVTRR